MEFQCIGEKKLEKSKSFINYFLRYCTAAIDVILGLYTDNDTKEFMDQLFQIPSLKRVAIQFEGYTAVIQRIPLCKYLKILHIRNNFISLGQEESFLVLFQVRNMVTNEQNS